MTGTTKQKTASSNFQRFSRGRAGISLLEVFVADTVNCTDTVPPSVSEAGEGEAVQVSELVGDWQKTVILDVY